LLGHDVLDYLTCNVREPIIAAAVPKGKALVVQA